MIDWKHVQGVNETFADLFVVVFFFLNNFCLLVIRVKPEMFPVSLRDFLNAGL